TRTGCRQNKQSPKNHELKTAVRPCKKNNINMEQEIGKHKTAEGIQYTDYALLRHYCRDSNL
ncbi:hypothetical protein L9F63_018849, partial [Diploptera punctata]